MDEKDKPEEKLSISDIPEGVTVWKAPEIMIDLRELVGYIIHEIEGGRFMYTTGETETAGLILRAKRLTDKYGFGDKPEQCCGTCGWWANSLGEKRYCKWFLANRPICLKNLPNWTAHMELRYADEGKDCKCWKGKE